MSGIHRGRVLTPPHPGTAGLVLGAWCWLCQAQLRPLGSQGRARALDVGSPLGAGHGNRRDRVTLARGTSFLPVLPSSSSAASSQDPGAGSGGSQPGPGCPQSPPMTCPSATATTGNGPPGPFIQEGRLWGFAPPHPPSLSQRYPKSPWVTAGDPPTHPLKPSLQPPKTPLRWTDPPRGSSCHRDQHLPVPRQRRGDQ